MSRLAPKDKTVLVGGQTRRLFLKQETADPDVAQMSLIDATEALREGLHDIARLAKKIEKANLKVPSRRALDAPVTQVWSLALDEICSCGVDLGPRLPFNGPRDFTGPERAPRAIAKAAPPLSTILKPVELDPLTVADDSKFLDMIAQQPNVPSSIKNSLRTLY
jgi:5-methylthioadenosine/S-adenosylhomocysteine deaminase